MPVRPGRLRRLRNGLLASPTFQRWARRLPLVRGVARREARALFDVAAGFVYSQILQACLRLDLLDLLREEALDAPSVARLRGLDPDATERLLRGAWTLGLLDRVRGRAGSDAWCLGPRGAALLGNPAVLAMVRHNAVLYEDLVDPLPLLRAGAGGLDTATGRFWAYARAGAAPDADDVRAYTRLMGETNALVADQLLDAVPLRGVRRLLDVGGGDGSFLRAVRARWPDVALALFDLPAVAATARERLTAEGMGDVECTGGDFRRDPLPPGADLITLVRILHDHDDDVVRTLLRAAHRALAPGGRAVVAEPMAEAPDAGTVGDAYFGFFFLAMGSGRPRTSTRLAELMRAAGFEDVRSVPTQLPLQAGVLVGSRAAAAAEGPAQNRQSEGTAESVNLG